MTPAVKAKDDLTTEIIRDKIEQIRFFEEVKLGDASIASTKVLPDIYEQENFRLLWTESDAIAQLVDALREIEDDGLNPEDYHLKELLLYHRAIQAIGHGDPWLSADFDLLLTDSFIRLAYHMYFGKVDPATLNPGWNLSRQFNDRHPAKAILEIIDAGSIKATIDSLKPQYPAYLRLKAALSKYRKIELNGGWASIPEGTVLRKGDRGPGVALLRKRLAMTDGVSAVNDDPGLFDDTLEKQSNAFKPVKKLIRTASSVIRL